MQRLENEKNLTLDPISYKDKRGNEILTPYIWFRTLTEFWMLTPGAWAIVP